MKLHKKNNNRELKIDECRAVSHKLVRVLEGVYFSVLPSTAGGLEYQSCLKKMCRINIHVQSLMQGSEIAKNKCTIK